MEFESTLRPGCMQQLAQLFHLPTESFWPPWSTSWEQEEKSTLLPHSRLHFPSQIFGYSHDKSNTWIKIGARSGAQRCGTPDSEVVGLWNKENFPSVQ